MSVPKQSAVSGQRSAGERIAAYWETKRARARMGIYVGTCDCGRLGRRFVGGDVVCDRCWVLDKRIHGAELSRGVVGYVGYLRLARNVREVEA